MPIYEYRCSACGHQEEHLQKVSDAPLSVCPSCGQPSYKKLLSAAGFQLKGSGWYVTDFRDKKPADKPGAGKATEKPAADKSDTKPETKSEPKKESKAAATTD
jgi:putative FmdB family regulatory protein